MSEHADVPPETVVRLRSLCMGLPEAYEEEAWVGTRWRIRKRTFAHVLAIDAGWPPAYARAATSDGPITVMTFRSSGPELDALSNTGHPFFKPRWRPDIVGMVLDAGVDWVEVAELVTESYLLLAPKRLAESAACCPGDDDAGDDEDDGGDASDLDGISGYEDAEHHGAGGSDTREDRVGGADGQLA